MADLDMKDAEILAGQLETIGHPYGRVATLATAQDLVDWCKGGFLAGRPWTPAEQATALVHKARMTFGDWTKAGGTTAFAALYQNMFPQQKIKDVWTPERAAKEFSRTITAAIARGHLVAPCELCKVDDYPYCEYGGLARHQRAKDEAEARALVSPLRPVQGFSLPNAITPAQMAAALEDEQRRRAEQQPLLHRLGVD